MDQKMKFIVIGLVGFSVICLFLFMQATGQKQSLLRGNADLKAENTTLTNKVNQLENDLKGNQARIDSLSAERDKAAQDLKNLQGEFDSLSKSFELVSKTRNELIEKLKRQAQAQASQQQAAAPGNADDAYWGAILKAKTDLEMQLSSVRIELRNLQISNESLQRAKGVLEIDINSLRNEKKDLLRQIEYNQKILDNISQEVVRERNDKVAIQESFKAVKAENDVLSRQLKSLSSRKEALDRKVQDLTEGKSIVEKRLNEMETMLSGKVSQIDALKNELDAIRSGKPQAAAAVENKRESAVELPAIVVRSSPLAENEQEEAPGFSGKILSVNTDNNFVIIDLGTSAGVKVGDEFNVYRDGKSIASLVAIQARDNFSACDIKKATTALRVGDNIK